MRGVSLLPAELTYLIRSVSGRGVAGIHNTWLSPDNEPADKNTSWQAPSTMIAPDWLASRGDLGLTDLMLGVAIAADAEFVVEGTHFVSDNAQYTLTEFISHGLAVELYLAADNLFRLIPVANHQVAIQHVQLAVQIAGKEQDSVTSDISATKYVPPDAYDLPFQSRALKDQRVMLNMLRAYGFDLTNAERIANFAMQECIDTLIAVLSTNASQVSAARLLLLTGQGNGGWVIEHIPPGDVSFTAVPLRNGDFGTLVNEQLQTLLNMSTEPSV